jgi:hypothetical protein
VTYNHLNESEDEQPISQEDLEALVSALGHTSIHNEAALRPTVKALEKLASEQKTAQERIVTLEKAINQLSLEVEYLKERDSEHNGWLKDRLHWKWSAGLAAVAVIAIAALVVNQNIALASLRSEMIDQFIRMERKVAEGPIKKTKK